jgi:RHS repeat-associated protein
MNPFRVSHKTQGIRPQNSCLSEPTSGVCLQNTNDYSPFGVILDGRTSESEFYRFGFQKQEVDPEISSEGNSINFEYRMYDTRIGRMRSTDPITDKYPFYSPYSFSGNRVIDAIEQEGLEPIVLNGKLVGYKVQSGQGPLAIAKDLNNPETQKKYGYSLISKVTYLDIVNSNPSEFKNVKNVNNINDPGFKKLKISEGDILSLGTVTKREKEIEVHNERILFQIKKNNKKIAEIKKEDSGPIMTEKEIKEQQEAISDGYDGEPTRTGEAFALIAIRAIGNKINQSHDIKEADKASRIAKLKKENIKLEQQLKIKDE